jgi:nucleotide-binding universal stress UspA family protein
LIEKILVAFDGSKPASKALDFALDIAEKYSAEILILSVAQPAISPILQYPGLGVPTAPLRPTSLYVVEKKTKHKKVLSETLRKISRTKPKLKVSTKLLEGKPSTEIVKAAEQGCYDLIVVGSQALGGIKKFFWGSLSERVANEANCPVLIVK